MNDLTIEEMQQLVIFYKQKSSDLEYEVLKAQILANRSIVSDLKKYSENKKSE